MQSCEGEALRHLEGHRGHISRSLSGEELGEPGTSGRDVGAFCAFLFYLILFPGLFSSVRGLGLPQAGDLGPLGKGGGLELTRTALQHGRVSQRERVPGCCSEQSETARVSSMKGRQRE